MLRKATALSVALTAACLTAIGATLTACSDSAVTPAASTASGCAPGFHPSDTTTGGSACAMDSPPPDLPSDNETYGDTSAINSRTIPDIVGMTIDNATAAMHNAGFQDTDFGFTLSQESANTVSVYPQDHPSDWKVTNEIGVGAAFTGGRLTISVEPVVPCTEDPALPITDCALADPNQHITYTVTGSARGDITYSPDGTSNSEQASSAHLPWTKKFLLSNSSDENFLYVSAQNTGSGKITCTITRDGEVVSTHTSTGAYSIVTCDNS